MLCHSAGDAYYRAVTARLFRLQLDNDGGAYMYASQGFAYSGPT